MSFRKALYSLSLGASEFSSDYVENFPLKKYIPFFAKAYQNLWHDVIDEELIANLELQTTFADATPSLSIKGKLAPFQCEILQFYK